MPTRTSKRNERLFSLSTSASSFGQFLFYRPVETVTGLIIDDEEEYDAAADAYEEKLDARAWSRMMEQK